ncbi:non-ribosomal peptide synthetase [Algoriphagus sp. AK58]|uniref:non-ribosomal peptide synthetase n=1 Tax=Algoriphagus sp. AK58 TaxID=1406877 RepID=UPI001650D1DB|nr:non-ribosomal peptide synthetase [Algoriphagus sp. AK58]MBC6367517.1 hypothetical protein [Algoriphagus sp. AK58]
MLFDSINTEKTATHQLFEQVADQYSNHTALVFEHKAWTYAQVNQQANQLAHCLMANGIGTESLVGICMDRSPELIISILAVWKAGAAYLPLDPDYPTDRLHFMIQDANPKLILTHFQVQNSKSPLELFSGKILVWEEFLGNSFLFSDQNPNRQTSLSDLAYVIYTSGSTGKPKGVLLEHRGLANLIPAQTKRFRVTPESRFLQFASLSFDTSLWEILLPLASGATLVIAKADQLLPDLPLSHTLNTYQITHFTAPPSVLALLDPSGLPELQVVVSGGEALRKEIAQRWVKHTKLFNAYGPTEATIEVSASLIQPNSDRITIGKPLPNTQFYILDQEGAQLPVGISGELHISGDGLARGYLNRPELNAEKFVPNPFNTGERMYRTGDLARWLPNGEVEHLGRIDQQVKLRGFRIELGEIESTLLTFQGIKDVVVTVLQGESGADFLCAYYVAQEELPMVELRNFLARSLPAYMIPARFMHLYQFPLTPNGKVDRKALPDPGYTVLTGVEFVAPATELEIAIARLWAQLLGLNPESISTQDSFFALGGDSLRAAQLAGRLAQETQTAVSVKDIFTNPTIESLSQLIAKKDKSASSVIAKAPVQDSYPLASAQKRVYLHHLRQGEESILYNMPAVYEVEGSLDLDLLKKAFQQVVDAYDSFRVSFGLVNGELRQEVKDKLVVDIPFHSFSEDNVHYALKNWGTTPFDLEKAPLVRMELWQTPSRQLLAIDTHHIIMDGMSYGPFFKALADAYQGKELKSDTLGFIDYAYWQQDLAQQSFREGQSAFWNQMFADGIPTLELPVDFNEPVLRNYLGETHSFRIQGDLLENIQSLCAQTGTTPFIFLYSAFTLLISKYAQSQDLVIATTSAGRSFPETEDMIGMFVNTLAVRNQIDPSLSFNGFLESTKQLLLSAFENDAYPYDELVAKLRAQGHQENLVRVMFTMLKESEESLALDGCKLNALPFGGESPAKFDLTFSGTENQDRIDFDIAYAAELFSMESITLLAERFVNLLGHICASPLASLSALPIILEKESEQIRNWNSNIVEVPQKALVHGLFEAKVLEYPGNTALVFENEELTYSELNQKANRLAHYLRSCGIGPEQRVGICLERSAELIISILAVWKSGGAYVPLDPSYPEDRLAYMIGDSGLELILTQNSLLPLLEEICQNTQVKPVSKEELGTILTTYPDQNPIPVNGPENLAYIIYTSGTTGKPKGAMIEHRNAVNLAFGQYKSVKITPNDRVLQFASTSFDASVWEILIGLTTGAALVVSRREDIMPGIALTDTLNRQGITVTMLTPTALNHMEPKQVPLLHTVLSAGEALPLSIALRWAGGTTLINAYGPTEVTVLTTRGEITEGVDRIVLGKPLPNYKTYILDAQGNQLPIGIAGELCIGGAGVGRGYLNRPELTAEKFVPDPFNPGAKMYRSGDLARWLPTGEIEYLGRIDQQVKIRGFRIELGEIESALLSDSTITEAAVTVRQDHLGEKYLCAYYVSETEKTVEELRSFLGQTLPEFMIPARFVAMEKLPLSPSGKIDRKALPDPGEKVWTGAEFVAPATELEIAIARLWAQLLALNPESISTRDSFFALGGDSLKSAQLAGRLSQETQTSVSVKDIFTNPTIADLAVLIASKEQSAALKITKAPILDSYPLAPAQKRVYLHQLQQGAESTLYNMPAVYQVDGTLDHALLEKAFQQVVDCFSSFRTSFSLEDSELRQQVASAVKVTVPAKDLSDSELLDQLRNWGKKPFDLEFAPLIRMELWQTPSRQILAIDTHHIIMDGMSYGPFFKALADAYQGKELKTDTLGFIDYAYWQQDLAQQSFREGQSAFWNQMFADGIPTLELPVDFNEPVLRNYLGETHSFRIQGGLLENIQSLCAQTGTTPFIFLYSAFTLLISKYAQTQDLVIATTSAGRNFPETEEMIGMFVNTLAVRNQIDPSRSFNGFLENTKQLLLSAFENDAYPYDELVAKLRAQGHQENLVRVMFTMLKESEESLALDGCKLNALPFGGESPAKFDLTFSGTENQDRIDFEIAYAAELFSMESITLLAERFVNLLGHICASPDTSLSDLPIILEKESEQIRNWNSNIVEVPQNALVQGLFEAKVLEYPGNTALVFEQEELTYSELNQKANRLAHYLRSCGISPEQRVGICLERSPELIISILAVWKSGGAYVPLDPSYPVDRLAYMIEDSGLELILTQNSLLPLLEEICQNTQVKPVNKEGLEKVLAAYPETNPALLNTADSLAYMIYTSGTTGKPKGVMLEHRNAVNLAIAQQHTISVKSTDRVLQFASSSFDASVFEILLALASGAGLVVASKENLVPGPSIVQTMMKQRVTMAVLTPVVLNHMDPHQLPLLHTVLSAGEPLPVTIAEKWDATKNLINAYGPTEVTVCATMGKVQEDSDRITIGSPLPNYKTYILDAQGNQLPIGIAGELCIGGAGVGRGYLNRPELTAEKFVPDPFNPGAKMYRSGDLARWLPTGEIEYLGRIDQQVKIRGFRIELGEIESALLSDSTITEAAVTVRQDHLGEKYLCAYYVSETEKTVEELRSFLGQSLPEFMIPARFVAMEKLPLSPSGKIDRKALPDPGGSILTGAEFVAPATELEIAIVRLWAQLLALNPESISTRDSFFALGGDSLKSAQLAGRLSQETQTSVSVKDIFTNPTIAGLAVLIASKEQSAALKITKAPILDSYPLAPAQKRVYLHQLQQGAESTLYNMPAVYQVDGTLDHAMLEKAFQQVVDCFSSFRTSFSLEDSELRQQVASAVKVTVPARNLSDSELLDQLRNWGKEPFDLEFAPLIRMELWQTPSRQLLAIDTHHIIMDGMSYGPFFESLSKAYAGLGLSVPSVQYTDYAYWQQSEEQQAVIARQRAYWQRIYAKGIPALELPYDFPIPTNRTHAGGTLHFQLGLSTVESVQQLAAQTGTTPFMVLYSVFALLVGKYAGQSELIVGTTSSGRNLPELEDMVGMLVNTLAIRTDLPEDSSFIAYLDSNKKVLLESFENDSYPYEDLVTDLRQKENFKTPVRAMFTMMPQGVEKTSIDSLRLSPLDAGGALQSKFDLTFSGIEGAESIDFSIIYPFELFDPETISLLASRYEFLLQQAIQRPDKSLREFSILVDQEKRMISEWNHTFQKYPTSQTLSELFESTVRLFPENMALVYKDRELKYKELESKANQLARLLIVRGIKPGELVGLLMKRSPELIVSILAVWKAGGAYVPLDPSYPVDRLHYMLQDAEVGLLLTHEAAITVAEKASEGLPTRMLILEHLGSELKSFSTTKIQCPSRPFDLAYIIYTSGSTGKPKGVMVEHRTAVNLAFAYKDSMALVAMPRILQFASICFDVSVADLLMAFANGGTLVIADHENLMPGPALTETLNHYQISHIKLTPTALGYLSPDDLPHLYTVYAGGEALSMELARRWASKKRLINAYGPTEATVNTTLRPIQSDVKRVVLGRPLPNYQIHILDQSGNPLPIGMAGELCIGGDGLARGYLNRPELTAEKFIPDSSREGGRLYRSGDLARWLSNGEVEFLGRIDHQVKIRGYRIECGEIESALLAIKGVATAAVIARTDAQGEKYLCAYFVADEEKTIHELREALSLTLPEFMVPSRFVQLDKLPLTGSGKTDRKALPEPDASIKTGTEFVMPKTETEKWLVKLWASVLGLNSEEIGINDDFFSLGGNSLRCVQLVGRIGQTFQLKVSVKDIFMNPTLESLSRLIDSREKVAVPGIGKAPILESYPLASAQKRVYLHQLQLGENSVLYNMPAAYEVDGSLNHALLEKAFQQVVDHYDAFRVSFSLVEGKLRQRVADRVTVDVPVHSLSESDAQDALKNWGTKSFDLEQAPLIRMELWQTPSRQILAIDTHHIIMDGMSHGPFFKALADAYQGKTLKTNTLGFIDYAYWQQSETQLTARSGQAEFWKQMFSNGIPALELPVDFSEPSLRNYRGGIHSFRMEGDLLESVDRLCAQTGTTPYIFLYSAFTLLISKYAQSQDLVIATTSAGRNLPETEEMIGMFVNTLAVRNHIDISLSFFEFLESTKELLLTVFENDSYPYDELIADLRSSQLGDHAVRVMFTMLKEGELSLSLGESILRQLQISDDAQAKFDLTLSVSEGEQFMGFDMVYAEELFSKESIERLSHRFVNLLGHICASPDTSLSDLPIILEKESEQIRNWNSNILEVPQNALVHGLFEAKVLEYPYNTALVFENEELTYSELNQKANRLAHYLRSCGIGAERRVGICLERSPELIISILAVWKSGGAYVPLDPSYPVDRLAYMIGDSGLELILTQNSLLPKLEEICQNTQVQLVSKEELADRMIIFTASNPVWIGKAPDLAYIIYTSGTTGRPKGAMIEHRNVVNLAFAQQQKIKVKTEDRVLQLASFSFDPSVSEILLAFLAGGTLVMGSRENLLPGLPLTTTINKNRITIAAMTPVVLNQLDPYQIPSLHTVVCGGEALPVHLAKKWHNIKNLINAYGPTEATVCATMGKVQEDSDRITIGSPLPNYKTYILDAQGNQLPIGIAGELCIGGAGVGRGYLNRPELTAEKFVPDPFNPGAKMYRSGDLARWLPTGEIEYLGRIDQQVKIRGFRIELGEIESALLSDSAITEAAVTVRQDHLGEKYLCAYYVSETEKTVEELRSFLGQTLPEFMIPARFVAMEKLLLSPSGKIDRKALPAPDENFKTGKVFIAPETDLEKAMIEAWATTLSISPDVIGMEDDFFALGGNSLKAVMLISKIHQGLKVQIPIPIIFQNPTPKSLMDHIHLGKAENFLFNEHLIPLQPNGDKRPLFIVPGMEGKSYYLADLAKALGKDQPVYGFQYFGLLNSEDPFESIEEIAAFNIRLMRKVQAQGPYQLAGHSMGGWVAVEMANQLLQQGEKIDFIGLMDSFSPQVLADLGGFTLHSKQQEVNDLIMLVERLVEYMSPDLNFYELKEKLEQIDSKERLSLVHQWTVSKGLIPDSFSRQELGQWAKLIGTNSRIHFEPTKIDQITHLFKAERSSRKDENIPECHGWTATVSSDLIIHGTPGNHYTMMLSPHVQSLAKAIQDCLQKSGMKTTDTRNTQHARELETLINRI